MTAAPPLHLLRGFVQWHDRRPGGGEMKTVDEAEGWVRYIAGQGFDEFSTWTTRRVTRAAELEGGSVFFVRSGVVLFRMPFLRVEAIAGDSEWAVVMRPALIRVEQRRVGMVRGWRYLKDADAPPDLPAAAEAGDAPPEMAAELRELGLA
ncbi:MAG: DUF1489 family protein [Rhodospirillaceae bacterium]|nr:DUF1489 family protein [Rhodospirillaceae bacterium]